MASVSSVPLAWQRVVQLHALLATFAAMADDEAMSNEDA